MYKRQSINSSEFDACYMTDNIDAGEMAAKEMLELLYDAGNSPTDPLEVGIQLSSDSSQAMVNRVSGFLNFWAGNAPVSYTHLDVYKRQVYKLCGSAGRTGCGTQI